MFTSISVVVCTYNGTTRLYPTLKHLAAQTVSIGTQWELIIVDNNSKDNTATIVKSYWEELGAPAPLNVIEEPRPGKANALVAGYNAANFELILLCDDDNWLNPNYFSIVLELFNQHPDIGMLGGYGKEAMFGKNEVKPEWFDSYKSHYVIGHPHKGNGFLPVNDSNIWGAGSVIRKKMWYYLIKNGFEFQNSRTAGKAMGEDSELSIAICVTGHKMYFDDRLWYYHDLSGRVKWEIFLNQMYVTGKTQSLLYLYHICDDYLEAGGEKSFSYTYFNQLLQIIKKAIRSTTTKDILSYIINQFKKRNIYYYFIVKYDTLKYLIVNRKQYYSTSKDILNWMKKVKNKYPLNN